MDGPGSVGVLVLRVWVELDGVLKARISRTLDLDTPESVTAASSVEEILAIVGGFVEEFAREHA